MSATKQPEWEFIANLGDANPLDYGGYFIYRDKTGVYEEEAEFWHEPEDENSPITVYRFALERKKMVGPYLVPFGYDDSWHHPVASYDEWFHKDLAGVASFVGATKTELERAFCSADPVDRAIAYRAIGEYHGFENLDSYPITVSAREAEKRYRAELIAIRRR